MTLDIVLEAYKDGASAEEIQSCYSSLDLADVHATIAYYLRHRQELDAYLAEQQSEADRVRAEAEEFFSERTTLRRVVDAHRDALLEKAIRDDVEWGLRGDD